MSAIRSASSRTTSVEGIGGRGRDDEADVAGLGAGDRVARQHEPLGPLRTQVVQPHIGGRDPHGAHRWEAEAGVLSRDDQIAVQGEIGPTGQAVPLDLRENGKGAVPEARPPVSERQHG